MPALLYLDGGCPVHSTSQRTSSAAVIGQAARQRAQRKKVPVMTDVAFPELARETVTCKKL